MVDCTLVLNERFSYGRYIPESMMLSLRKIVRFLNVLATPMSVCPVVIDYFDRVNSDVNIRS